MARTNVKHTAAEPLLVHATGEHITVSLHTDIYTVRGPKASDRFDWFVRDLVNSAVARYVSRGQPRMPSTGCDRSGLGRNIE